MESVQSALNITDNSIHVGFWFTVKDVEGCHSLMRSTRGGCPKCGKAKGGCVGNTEMARYQETLGDGWV